MSDTLPRLVGKVLMVPWWKKRIAELEVELSTIKKRIEESPEAVILENGWQTKGIKKAIRHYQEIAKSTGESCRVRIVREEESHD